jgi:hypothetical protein
VFGARGELDLDQWGIARNRDSQLAGTIHEVAMTKPVPDKAEVTIEFPDKLCTSTFERTARFDAHFDETGVAVSLHHRGAAETCKSVTMHFDYLLFAEILGDLAKSAAAGPPTQEAQREALRNAAEQLYLSLARSPIDDVSTLTPDDEVRLLHVLE